MVKMKGMGKFVEKPVMGRNTLDSKINKVALNKGSFPPAEPNEKQLRQFAESTYEIKKWNRAVLKAREALTDPLRKY